MEDFLKELKTAKLKTTGTIGATASPLTLRHNNTHSTSSSTSSISSGLQTLRAGLKRKAGAVELPEPSQRKYTRQFDHSSHLIQFDSQQPRRVEEGSSHRTLWKQQKQRRLTACAQAHRRPIPPAHIRPTLFKVGEKVACPYLGRSLVLADPPENDYKSTWPLHPFAEPAIPFTILPALDRRRVDLHLL